MGVYFARGVRRACRTTAMQRPGSLRHGRAHQTGDGSRCDICVTRRRQPHQTHCRATAPLPSTTPPYNASLTAMPDAYEPPAQCRVMAINQNCQRERIATPRPGNCAATNVRFTRRSARKPPETPEEQRRVSSGVPSGAISDRTRGAVSKACQRDGSLLGLPGQPELPSSFLEARYPYTRCITLRKDAAQRHHHHHGRRYNRHVV